MLWTLPVTSGTSVKCTGVPASTWEAWAGQGWGWQVAGGRSQHARQRQAPAGGIGRPGSACVLSSFTLRALPFVLSNPPSLTQCVQPSAPPGKPPCWTRSNGPGPSSSCTALPSVRSHACGYQMPSAVTCACGWSGSHKHGFELMAKLCRNCKDRGHRIAPTRRSSRWAAWRRQPLLLC